MVRVARASSESKEPSLTCRKEERERRIATSMLIARPISSPSPWFSGCRQLAWKAGIAGEVMVFKGTSDPVLGHATGKSGDAESDIGGGGTVLVPGWSFGIAQEIGSITSVPFGEKENFAAVSPRVPARGPRRASLSLARKPPPSGTVVHCGCAGARKGRGRQPFCI
jgi:hypothetical protein